MFSPRLAEVLLMGLPRARLLLGWCFWSPLQRAPWMLLLFTPRGVYFRQGAPPPHYGEKTCVLRSQPQAEREPSHRPAPALSPPGACMWAVVALLIPL